MVDKRDYFDEYDDEYDDLNPTENIFCYAALIGATGVLIFGCIAFGMWLGGC